MKTTIGVIGSGSWGTALVNLLTQNGYHVNWFVQSQEIREHVYEYGHNPHYLSSASLNMSRLRVTIKIDDLIEASSIIILVVPSAFLHSVLSKSTYPLKDKKVVSAVKGIIPESNEIVADYLFREFNVPREHFAMIAGPSHAEEVSSEKLTYLTVASEHVDLAKELKLLLKNHHINVKISHDIVGTEFAAVAKNVYAIAAGIYHGLGYGDNFQAVLVCNATQEMREFMSKVCRVNADIIESAYLGDLLVTMYSQYSRNRNFGVMIGKGYSVKYARMEMLQIAEGYYGAKGLAHFMEKLNIDMPIAEAVFNVLYEGQNASNVFSELTNELS
ncbi:NAD(P)H-dependent glycerol-3-phosphate dehydrogenase [Salinivirga cyanobacteriivorans]